MFFLVVSVPIHNKKKATSGRSVAVLCVLLVLIGEEVGSHSQAVPRGFW